MILTISGVAGSGKSTVARLLAKKLGLKHHSSGDFMRQMAQERGLTLLELSKLAEKDKAIDKELDDRQKEIGKKEDNFIIDGRLSAFFIPHADFKIFLDCETKEAAKRIMKDKRHGDRADNIADMVKIIKKRQASEKKRYRNYYGCDPYDRSIYDIVIDSSDKKPEDVLKIIMDRITI